MNKTQIEAWTLNIIDRVKAGQPIEDSRVELKSSWIDSAKAARRIAGHANAARGEPILWLIGVDEENGVVGAKHEDLANWYAEVQKQFDDLAPALIDLNVPVEGTTIVALLFETDRVPFVVKNPSGGTIQFEVPWREGTRLRSAKRSDLIRLLVPLQIIPDIQVLEGKVTARVSRGPSPTLWQLSLLFYVIPRTNTRIVIPFHQCSVVASLAGHFNEQLFPEIRLDPPYAAGTKYSKSSGSIPPQPILLSETVVSTPSEVLIDGPGLVRLRATLSTPPINNVPDTAIHFDVRLQPVNTDHNITFNIDLNAAHDKEGWQWILKDP